MQPEFGPTTSAVVHIKNSCTYFGKSREQKSRYRKRNYNPKRKLKRDQTIKKWKTLCKWPFPVASALPSAWENM